MQLLESLNASPRPCILSKAYMPNIQVFWVNAPDTNAFVSCYSRVTSIQDSFGEVDKRILVPYKMSLYFQVLLVRPAIPVVTNFQKTFCLDDHDVQFACSEVENYRAIMLFTVPNKDSPYDSVVINMSKTFPISPNSSLQIFWYTIHKHVTQLFTGNPVSTKCQTKPAC
jgi:hypothetical protein